MKKVLIVLLVSATLMFAGIRLYSQNNMPLIQSLAGEYLNSYFGKVIASIDFNADGYDDVAVFTLNSGINHWSSVQIYFGGPNMDAVPDLIRESTFQDQVISTTLLNIGDVNGDNYDDLMISELYSPEITNSLALRIFYGGTEADLEPDFTLNSSWFSEPEILPIWYLGDVNGDGLDDIGIYHFINTNYPDLAILLGGTFQIVTIQYHICLQRYHKLAEAGDVNNDGFDDFIVGFALEKPEGIITYRYLYYGGNPLNLNNRVLLRCWGDSEWSFPGGYGVGDFNGDGYDDFVYCEGNSWRDNNKLRLGGINIMETEEFTLHINEHIYNLMDMSDQGVAYGDFNGDGYSDLAGSDYTFGLWTGHAGVWLGGENPNGLFDLRITAPPTSPFHQFGRNLVSGDFNGDGYCDLAISAHHSNTSGNDNNLGYVYIFAGNAQLLDTPVANEDVFMPPVNSILKVKYFPNPNSSNNQEISYEIEGPLPEHISTAKISIYNIKGQVITNYQLDTQKLKSKRGILPAVKLKPGVYIVAMQINGKRVSTEKITINEGRIK